MTSPFDWRDKPRAIDLKKQNEMTKWLISISKHPNPRVQQRTFTDKGKVLAEQRKQNEQKN